MNKKIINGLIFISLFLGMYLYSYIPALIFNIDLSKLSKTMLIIYSFLCDIGYIIILLFIYKDKIINNYKDYINNYKKYISISIKYYIIGLIIMIFSNFLIEILFTNANSNNDDAIRLLIDKYPWYMLFSITIYAPFVEEIIFRKSIKNLCYSFTNKYIKYIYIILSGFIFALLHVIGNVNNYQDYFYIIPYLSLGICFAILYNKTNNIFTTITLHSFHNLLTFIIYILGGIF